MNLNHLSKQAAQAAELDDAFRLQYLLLDQFVPYPRALAAVNAIDELVSDPDKSTPRGVLLVGEPQMGKSAVIDEVCARHPASDNIHGDAAIIHVLRIQFPDARKDSVYGEVLRTFNAKVPASARPDQMRGTALNLQKSTGVKLFVVDELANVTTGTKNAQGISINSIKFIMNDRRRPVVLSVTKPVYNEIIADDMVRHRFDVIKLGRFTDSTDTEFTSFLSGWEMALPLRHPSGLASANLAVRFHELGEGHVGQTIKALRMAARTAIEMGVDKINEDVLEEMKFMTPKQAFDMVQEP